MVILGTMVGTVSKLVMPFLDMLLLIRMKAKDLLNLCCQVGLEAAIPGNYNFHVHTYKDIPSL